MDTPVKKKVVAWVALVSTYRGDVAIYIVGKKVTNYVSMYQYVCA